MRFAALDTRFLLALAGGEPDAEATIDYLQRNGFSPIITESVVEQLGELQQDRNNPAYEFAILASRNFVTWGMQVRSGENVIIPTPPRAQARGLFPVKSSMSSFKAVPGLT